MSLRITNPNQLDIPLRAQALLAQMFPECQELVLKEDYSSLGYSGSWVYRVHLLKVDDCPELPLVVKIAAASLIQKEARAFQECVRDRWPDIAELRGQPVILPEGDLGGLCYSLMGGGVFTLQSLREYCLQAGVEDATFVLQQRLFRVMLKQTLLPARNVFEFPLRASYDAVLPVNLVLEPRPLPPGSTPVLVTPSTVPRSALQPGTPVRIEGFAVIEVDPRHQTVTLNTPRDGIPTSYRVRLRPVPDLTPYQVDGVLVTIEGMVTETRQSFWHKELAKALGPQFDPACRVVALFTGADGHLGDGPMALPNPLLAIPEILRQNRHIKVNHIHGDLNLENVLVDPQVRDVRLIDFASARRDHVLHDFLRLETEVITRLIPGTLTKARLPPQYIHPFYEQLHCATFQFDQSGVHRLFHPALEKPFAILSAIRRAARDGFYDREDVSEYYQGLTLYLLGALKYGNLDQIPGSKRVAFLGAATVQQLLHGDSPCDKYLPSYKARVPCPYRGLYAFHQEHAPVFFGREDLTSRLLDRLRAALETGDRYRLLAIVGPSGSGKSSVAQAGLVAALRRGELAGGRTWQVVRCQPGADPLDSLGAALYKAKVIDLSEVDDLCQGALANERTLHRVTYQVGSGQWLVLLVDQFEEAFTLCDDDVLRRAFIDNLLYAAGVAGGQMAVVLTLRADFYGHCAGYELANVLPTHHELVHPMSESELRRAIEQPAYEAGRVYQPGLVDRLLGDVGDQPGGLPLLQYALLELWHHCSGQQLTHDAYDETGRVGGSLERRAEGVYEVLTPEERAICQRIFLHLIQPGEGGTDTGRRATFAEMSPTDGNLPALERVVRQLADARLVTTEGDTVERSVQIAHEALIRGWRRLHDWIDENRESLRLRRRLSDAAREWQENSQDASYLCWGMRLAQIELWAEAYTGDLSELERAFLGASQAARHQQRQVQAKTRSCKLARDSLRLIWSDPDLALLLAIEAGRAADTAEAANAVRNSLLHRRRRRLLGHQGAVRHVAWNRAGTRIATASADGTARVWDAESRTELATLRGHGGGIWRVAWSRSGARLATASDDGTARLWDVESGTQQAVLDGHGKWTYCVAWNSDDTRILTAGREGRPWVWDAETGAQLAALMGHQQDTPNRVSQRRDMPRPGRVVCAAWSLDNTRILAASTDGSARVWEASSGIQRLELFHCVDVQGGVYWAAWSPDERHIVTAGADREARIWDAQSGALLAVLSGHQSWVFHAAWSPDGTRILTASVDGTTRVWDAESGIQLLELTGHLIVRHADWSPGGRRIVTCGDDGTARIWDATTGSERTVLRGHTDRVEYAAWNPTGTWIATASDDGTAQACEVDPEGRSAVQLSRIGMKDLLNAACQRAVRNMSHQEWKEYVGEEPYRETCPGQPVPESDPGAPSIA